MGRSFCSPAAPVHFPASGRGERMPLPDAPAGPSLDRGPGRVAVLWPMALALAAAYLGPDRVNTLRFAGAFCVAALLQFGLARAAYERLVPSAAEMHS
jgi:hypothetical protein